MAHPKLGFWLPPGGHVEWYENPVTALIREYDEEVGIDLTPYLPQSVQIDHATVLPLPRYLLETRVPENKPNPGDPEHFFLDLLYVVRPPPLPVRQGVRAEWISANQLMFFYTPENVRRFTLEQMRKAR